MDQFDRIIDPAAGQIMQVVLAWSPRVGLKGSNTTLHLAFARPKSSAARNPPAHYPKHPPGLPGLGSERLQFVRRGVRLWLPPQSPQLSARECRIPKEAKFESSYEQKAISKSRGLLGVDLLARSTNLSELEGEPATGNDFSRVGFIPQALA